MIDADRTARVIVLVAMAAVFALAASDVGWGAAWVGAKSVESESTGWFQWKWTAAILTLGLGGLVAWRSRGARLLDS